MRLNFLQGGISAEAAGTSRSAATVSAYCAFQLLRNAELDVAAAAGVLGDTSSAAAVLSAASSAAASRDP